MSTIGAIEQGRDAFERHAWADAFSQLAAADRDIALPPEDLERLATAAYLTGRAEQSDGAGARAYNAYLERGDTTNAARCAFWLGFHLIGRGEVALGSGWLGRAARLLDESGDDTVVRGFLLVPVALQALEAGATAEALAHFEQAGAVGERFHDSDLLTLSSLGRGQALLQLGKTREGLASLDEAMVAVAAREVSPLVAGIVYCAAIEACHSIFDLQRAEEWTHALTEWCDAQPDLIPFRGQCVVYRAELLQIHGAWRDASNEARRALEWLAGDAAAGMALYQQGELHRLRGQFSEAETAYRQAAEKGRRPDPGLALLRLAQAKTEQAAANIRRALDEARDPMTRARLLPAYVEIMLAADDSPAARQGADELDALASKLGAPLLQAVAAHAEGAVRLAQGDARAALGSLREAWGRWQEVQAPYEASRTRVLIGLCCRALADEDSAEMEIDAARREFERIGALPDRERAASLLHGSVGRSQGGLTAREIEVLRLLAAGKTNRAIAAELVISEKTVARHVSNIFTKLGLSSRAGATAYAYEQRLV